MVLKKGAGGRGWGDRRKEGILKLCVLKTSKLYGAKLQNYRDRSVICTQVGRFLTDLSVIEQVD